MADNFAADAQLEKFLATQTRKSSIIFLSSSVNVNDLQDVRGTTGVPMVLSNISAANPLLVIPCIWPPNSRTWVARTKKVTWDGNSLESKSQIDFEPKVLGH